MILEQDWNKEDKHESLTEVLATREIEKLYDLPVNKVLQDIRRGNIRHDHCRQSGKVWLVTRAECNRLYSNFVKQVKRKPKQVS